MPQLGVGFDFCMSVFFAEIDCHVFRTRLVSAHTPTRVLRCVIVNIFVPYSAHTRVLYAVAASLVLCASWYSLDKVQYVV